MAEMKMRLNLVIDTKNQKVLYAEVEKPFVDFLFHLLTAPVCAVIMQLTNKDILGPLQCLYDSVQSFSESCMELNQSKDLLLGPSYNNWTPTLPTPKKYYLCSNPSKCLNMSHVQYSVCPKCSNHISSPVVNWIPSGNKKLPSTHVSYVKGGLIYMVTDALFVKPLSTMSIIELLKELNIKELGSELEGKVVDFTVHQGLKLLLNASFQSKNVLTTVFLGNACKVEKGQ